MSLILETNEGRILRRATPPDVSADPRLKNYIWVKTSNPPAMCVYNDVTGLWVCSDGSTTGGVTVPQLASVTITPPSGSVAEGFALSHGAVGVSLWYSLNGGPFILYPGGYVLVGTGYFYIAVYASKPGFADSPIEVAEFVTEL